MRSVDSTDEIHSGRNGAKAMDRDLLFIPLVIAFWIWVVWFIVTTIRRYKTSKLQAELRGKLLDKLGSSQEVLAYLQTDSGKQFLLPFTGEQKTLQGRLISAFEVSVILVLVGVALLSLGGSGVVTGPHFLVFGTLILALGLGFALAGAVSYYLSRSLGLLDGTTGRRG
jgi:hypothetical protein